MQAIIEFKVTTPEELLLTSLTDIVLGEEYPEPAAIFRGFAHLKFEPGLSPQFSEMRQEGAGFAYARADNRRTVQVGLDFFTFIWQGEYSSWEDFIGEVEHCWLAYREVAGPLSVESIGVRFVNSIPMPVDRSVEIRDYLRISVDIPAALPQIVENLFTQVDIPMPSLGVSATITTSVADADERSPGGSLVLDIDVKAPLAMATIDDSFSGEMGTKLNTLRFAKNLVFEACITDATRERID